MTLDKVLTEKIKAFEARKGQKTHSRTDVYVNAFSGFGGPRDPISRTRFAPGQVLSQTELDTLYRFDWITRRIVGAIPEDVCRQGIALNIEDQELSAKVTTRFEELNLWAKLQEALSLARLYGGALMVLGAQDGEDPAEPLNPEKVKSIRCLNNLDRWQVSVAKKYNDPLLPNYGEPEIYRVQTGQQQVHESRVLRFDGAYLPERQRQQNQGWHDPVITGINETLKHYGTSVQAGAVLFQDFITKVLKIPDLANLIADGEEATLQARIQYAVNNMSSLGVSLIGRDEAFEKIQTPITGLVELMDKYMDLVAAASGIPKTRLFGQQLGTLSGADETTRNYYDTVRAYQHTHLKNPINRLIHIILAAEKARDTAFSFEFDSLWQPTEKEVAETRKIVAETDQIYISNDVATPEEIAVSRFGADGYSMETALDVEVRSQFKAAEKERPEDGE